MPACIAMGNKWTIPSARNNAMWQTTLHTIQPEYSQCIFHTQNMIKAFPLLMDTQFLSLIGYCLLIDYHLAYCTGWLPAKASTFHNDTFTNVLMWGIKFFFELYKKLKSESVAATNRTAHQQCLFCMIIICCWYKPLTVGSSLNDHRNEAA